ncbi:MAG: hypothetical protein HUU37_10520, partial [Bdellovibrionales bacterium]|nr:hypothetical protein [Bdellovibrionales bacterium]
RHVAQELAALGPHNSYLPAWEDLHAGLHSLKGIVNILATPPGMGDFIVRFTHLTGEALAGSSVIRRGKEMADALLPIAQLLEQGNGSWNLAELSRSLDKIPPLMEPDIPHERRLEDIPADLYYVSELVSKKAREIALLRWNHCIVEDQILLDQVPFWKTQLLESLEIENRGRGFVVNFLPFIGPEGGRELKVWAWVGAPTDTRAALKQRVKAVMPKVQITSIRLHSDGS